MFSCSPLCHFLYFQVEYYGPMLRSSEAVNKSVWDTVSVTMVSGVCQQPQATAAPLTCHPWRQSLLSKKMATEACKHPSHSQQPLMSDGGRHVPPHCGSQGNPLHLPAFQLHFPVQWQPYIPIIHVHPFQMEEIQKILKWCLSDTVWNFSWIYSNNNRRTEFCNCCFRIEIIHTSSSVNTPRSFK